MAWCLKLMNRHNPCCAVPLITMVSTSGIPWITSRMVREPSGEPRVYFMMSLSCLRNLLLQIVDMSFYPFGYFAINDKSKGYSIETNNISIYFGQINLQNSNRRINCNYFFQSATSSTTAMASISISASGENNDDTSKMVSAG